MQVNGQQVNSKSAIIRIEVLENNQGDEMMVSMQGSYYDAGGDMRQYDVTKLSHGNKAEDVDVTKMSYTKAIAKAQKLRSQGAEFQLVTIRSKL